MLAAAVLHIKPTEEDRPPKALKWSSVDVSGIEDDGAELDSGLRALERIPGTNRHVGVVGHTGTRHDLLRIALWDEESGEVQDRDLCLASMKQTPATLEITGR
ncbi:MAG: hypothetical protein QF473_15135 [Planctomycetota bacterium]|jgi:hypothetical protein|nr:hypothetical protein [Planctomycetota bacterium]